jgi:RHS repeat-associated protein
VNWFLPDLHGSIAASLDSTEASISSAIRYDAWGQTIATGAQTGSPASVGDKPWRYQGRLDISQTALGTPLYDMSARMYSPGSGTFTSLDSVLGSAQNPLSMNRFLYALANPATLIDPTGHYACSGWDDDCAYIQANALEKTEQHTADTREAAVKPSVDHESSPPAGPQPEIDDLINFEQPGLGDLSAMSHGQLQRFVLSYGREHGRPNFHSYDYQFAFCLLGGGEPAGCWEGVRPRGIDDLDGPLGTALAAGLGIGVGTCFRICPVVAKWLGNNQDRIGPASQIAQNAAAGRSFEQVVLNALRFAKNGQPIPGIDRLGQLRAVIPDSLQRGILEIKSGIHITDARGQISAMSELAVRAGEKLNLVVGPNMQSVSGPVQNLVLRTGGSIFRFDAATGVFTTLFGSGGPTP